MSAEGRERFFRAIAERIDTDRVEEVHLFPAIRQGGRESGVAVVTIRIEEPVDPEQPAGPEGSAASATSDEAVVLDAPEPPAVLAASSAPEPADAPVASEPVVEFADSEREADPAGADAAVDPAGAEPVVNPTSSEPVVGLTASERVVDLAASEPENDSASTESPVDPDVSEPTRIEGFAADELAEDFMEASPEPAPAQPPRRFTVLRAHYVLMLKGPDRGKWEVGVVEEADAPAATVDEVVRGVHERAGGWGGDADVPERLTGDDFRAALIEEPWTASR